MHAMKNRLLAEKRSEIIRLAERHGAKNLRIFGSMARQEDTAHSDIDFLVDVSEHRSPFFPGGLIADLEDLLGKKVDIVTENGLHWYIKERILNEAVPL